MQILPIIKSESGFTLLELLVSITIAGVIFVILLSGFGQNIKSTGHAEDYTTASFLARSVIAELESRALAPGQLEGDFGEKYPRFSWEAKIARLEGRRDFSIQLTINFVRQSSERSLLFSYLIKSKESNDGGPGSSELGSLPGASRYPC